jgi:UDP:flavonoid glycosyltransferase YjiC (YdhE family)
VAIPVTHDQPGVAARIADKKTGLFVPLRDVSSSRLGLLIDEVLNDSMYLENTRYFQKSLAEYNGLSVAAELLENAFGLTKASDNSAKYEKDGNMDHHRSLSRLRS